MHWTKLVFGLALAILFGSIQSMAVADNVVPPDNSAINQYKATLPAPGGDRSAENGATRSPAQILGTGNARRLERLGSDGRATAKLAADTAPPARRVNNNDGVPSHASPDGDSGMSEVLGQATGSSSGEMGLLLPIVLGMTIMGAIAYVVARRRSAHSP